MGLWGFLLVGIVCLSLPGKTTAGIDCLLCWSDACSGAPLAQSVRDDCCSRCVVDGDCRATQFGPPSETCCSTAESSILSVFTADSSEDSEVCDSSHIYLGDRPLEQIFPGDSLTGSLQPGTYVMPNLTFSCSGCIEEVVLRGEDSTIAANVGIELLFWARYHPPEGENELHRILRRVPISTGSVVTSPERPNLLYDVTFNLQGNDACFTDSEVFGFSFEESGGLEVLLTSSSDQNVQVYQVTQPTENNCSNLMEFVDLSSSPSLTEVPAISLRIRPTIPSPTPSTSASHSLSPTAIITRELVPPDLTPVMTPSAVPVSTGGSTDPTSDTSGETFSISTLPIIVGVIGGAIAILMLLIVILLFVFLTRRCRHSEKDKTDAGRQIVRVRSRRLEQRIHSQASGANLLPSPTADPFYDYPRPEQLHHYHQLEGPTEMQVLSGHSPISPTWSNDSSKYTTMYPVGSVREGGAITPVSSNMVANGINTGRTIYDDEVASELAASLNSQPRVQDTPFYHVLEQPRELNGEMVPELGYDVPRALLKAESTEEVHSYGELEAGPQQHMQIVDPATGHPYHMLEESSRKESDAVSVQECGLYVPTAEERKRISGQQNTGEISAGDLENWIKRSRLESSKKRRFFELSSTYWAPPAEADKLYDTLARRKYREILSEQIQIVKYIGHGQFGTVNLAKWTQQYVDPMDVAVKVCRAGLSENLKTKFLMEAAIMGQFRHVNVVKLHGVVTMSEQPMIVLELMKHGDLLTYLETNYKPGKYPPPSNLRLLSFSQQVAAGMNYLSNKSFIHRDLAARNVLLNEMMQCKIGDFGMARDLQDSDYYIMSRRGPMPLKWTAPEAINYRKYSSFSDCYSYGMLLYEIWSVGRPPLPDISIKEVPNTVSKGYCQPPPPGCPRAIYALMVKLWDPKYRRRPPFPTIVEYLTKKDEELLAWSEEDRAVSSQAAQLGAPLEHGKDLYPLLQNTYQSSWC